VGLGADENDDEDGVLDKDTGRERTDTSRCRCTDYWFRDEDEGQNKVLALRGVSEMKCGQ
jgi:hypothetical protein